MNKSNENKNKIHSQYYGTLNDGREVQLFTLKNGRGMEVQITNYGGIVKSVKTPDREGNMENVVLGFDSLENYVADNPYFGSVVGRYCNRIANGRFSLNGTSYQLTRNEGEHHLHGGDHGFFSQLWHGEPQPDGTLELSYHSQDGEEGYPGNVEVAVKYSVTDKNELKVEFRATTDKATPLNLTNHSYFNLSGEPDRPILDHHLKINADYYTPVDDKLIPTGELKSIASTGLDFRESKRIGTQIGTVPGGYDHNYVINRNSAGRLTTAANLYSPQTGRKLTVYTTEPGLQFYSGNFPKNTVQKEDGSYFVPHAALCLETQHLPNSPNEPDFPSTILKPGEAYHSTTIFAFDVL